jgi:hypothetical protein
LVMRRLCDWRELLRRVNFFEVVKALNGDKASTPMVSLWFSFRLVGCSQRRYRECFPCLR